MKNMLPLPQGKKIYRCLSCGATENMGRRRYCSTDCRLRLRLRLDMRTGLIQALNTRFATFYFSDLIIRMDMLPYGSREVFSFIYPRSPGKKPAEDFGNMADMLGNAWWMEKRRTQKRYLATRRVMMEAICSEKPIFSVRPSVISLPSIKDATLQQLNLRQSDLIEPELINVIRNAYRRQAKRCHPDAGGDAQSFLNVHRAYEELIHWAENPVYVKHRGFPDKWLYDGHQNRWLQPVPIRASGK